MSAPVLKCTSISKSYDYGLPILKDFSLELGAGKIFGLLGPNGCGKSTLMKLITGLLSVDSGVIEILGEIRSERTNSLISYLPERTYLSPTMKVSELIAYFTDFYPDFRVEVARKMLEDMDISLDARLKTLSKGTKEKVQLVMVMARNAKLYLLDEPIAGVDPAAREYILNTIVSNYRETATVIVSTHLIADIESIIDSYVFIKDGNIIECRDIDELKSAGVESLDAYFREVFKYV